MNQLMILLQAESAANLFFQILGGVSVIAAVFYGILKFISDKRKAELREREAYQASFENTVSQLTSTNVDISGRQPKTLRRI